MIDLSFLSTGYTGRRKTVKPNKLSHWVHRSKTMKPNKLSQVLYILFNKKNLLAKHGYSILTVNVLLAFNK